MRVAFQVCCEIFLCKNKDQSWAKVIKNACRLVWFVSARKWSNMGLQFSQYVVNQFLNEVDTYYVKASVKQPLKFAKSGSKGYIKVSYWSNGFCIENSPCTTVLLFNWIEYFFVCRKTTQSKLVKLETGHTIIYPCMMGGLWVVHSNYSILKEL